MEQEFQMIAKTFQGLENVLAEELTNLGANNIQIGRRMVSFTGDKGMMYRANFYLRTAVRILKPIKEFDAKDADEVYEVIKAMKWEDILDIHQTFAIDAVVYSEEFRHSMFVAYKVKDAIVDHFREKFNERPSVRINNPDIQLNMHIAETHCTLSLDSSGESLHRRGYRQEAVEAPLNEVLAAGMILMTGWRGECDLIDPMCGSGTIPIEAALIARNIAPGVFRKGYAFEKWPDFNEDMFQEIYNDDSLEREQTCHIYGYDNNANAIAIATNNIKAAGVSKNIELKLQSFENFQQPENKSIIITNPPYGERISTNDLLGLYDMIGERLKHAFMGNEAWVLSYRRECFDEIGLRPSDRIPLFNGALECEYRKYEIFGGKYVSFREEHTNEEREHNRYKVERPRNTSHQEYRPHINSDRPRRDDDGRSRRDDDRRPRRDDDRRPRRDDDRRPRRDDERRPRMNDDRPHRYGDRPRRDNDRHEGGDYGHRSFRSRDDSKEKHYPRKNYKDDRKDNREE